MKKLLLVFTVILLTFGCKKQASDNLRPEIETKTSKQSGKFFPKPKELPKANGVLFKFKEGVDRKSFKSMPYKYHKYFGKIETKNVDSLIQVLKMNPLIESAEPNYAVTTQDLNPNDPYYTDGTLWGMNTIGANTAWNSGNVGSAEQIVAVLDEGNQYWHCDLNNNVWTNPYEIPDNNIDDDGNGFADDIHGWNFYNSLPEVYTGNDDHGTHVAGTIAGKGNNGIGVIGVAPKVKILPVKFLADAGYIEHAIMGIDYIIDLKQRHNLNIRVINNSWGGGGYLQTLLDAINRAKAAGILFVCAAGNGDSNNDINQFYPAGYNQYADNVISVGAMTSGLTRASFSNYGQTVDLFAPGVNIMSTLPLNHINSGYGAYAGTSMATPHVSGAAAAFFSLNPDASYLQCKQALLNGVTKTDVFTSLCKSGGYLNVSSFTGTTSPIVPDATCGTPPALDITPPTIGRLLSVTPQNIDWVAGTVDLHAEFIPPTDESGINQHWFRMYNNGFYDYWWILGGFGGGEFTFTGLSIGAAYGIFDVYYQVNDNWGNWSDTSNHIIVNLNDTTPPPADTEAPSIPSSLSVSNPTTSSLTLNWGASTDNIGVIAYKINWRVVGGSWLETTVTSTSNTFNNLSQGTTYEFNVQAVDAAGNWSGVSATVSGSTLNPSPTDVIPPVVNITSPQDGYQIPVKGNRNVKISFTATDNVGVTLRQILIDGVVVATNVSNYTWNAVKATPGNHIITCNAFDAAGNQASQSVTVIKL